MTEQEIVEYLKQKDSERYIHDKDVQKTIRWAILSILGMIAIGVACITTIVCFYMYYVVPVEDVSVDGNSKVVMESVVDNGSNLWQ